MLVAFISGVKSIIWPTKWIKTDIFCCFCCCVRLTAFMFRWRWREKRKNCRKENAKMKVIDKLMRNRVHKSNTQAEYR